MGMILGSERGREREWQGGGGLEGGEREREREGPVCFLNFCFFLEHLMLLHCV